MNDDLVHRLRTFADPPSWQTSGHPMNDWMKRERAQRIGHEGAIEIERLRALLAELVDADECWYDHHGYCQTHSLDEQPCPHERAKALLRQVDVTDIQDGEPS